MGSVYVWVNFHWPGIVPVDGVPWHGMAWRVAVAGADQQWLQTHRWAKMKLLKTSATFFSRENHLDFLEVDGKCEEEEGLCLTSRYYPAVRGEADGGGGEGTLLKAVQGSKHVVGWLWNILVILWKNMKHIVGKMAKQIPGERGGRWRRRRGDSTKE